MWSRLRDELRPGNVVRAADWWRGNPRWRQDGLRTDPPSRLSQRTSRHPPKRPSRDRGTGHSPNLRLGWAARGLHLLLCAAIRSTQAICRWQRGEAALVCVPSVTANFDTEIDCQIGTRVDQQATASGGSDEDPGQFRDFVFRFGSSECHPAKRRPRVTSRCRRRLRLHTMPAPSWARRHRRDHPKAVSRRPRIAGPVRWLVDAGAGLLVWKQPPWFPVVLPAARPAWESDRTARRQCPPRTSPRSNEDSCREAGQSR